MSIAGIVLLASGILTYLYIRNNSETNGNVSEDNFTLVYEYQGNNTWSYTVTGILPTPCYSATAEAIVMESYPEQVQIKVTTTEDTTVEICSTVVKDFTYTGNFNASKLASITLVVE